VQASPAAMDEYPTVV